MRSSGILDGLPSIGLSISKERAEGGMPGHSGSEHPWGQLPLLIDTSAWARAGHPSVRDEWLAALYGERVRIAPPTRVEIPQSARGGVEFDQLEERLDTIRPAPLTPATVRAAEAAMRALAHRSAGARRLPVVDYLVAAAAREIGGAVLHYDGDYDTLAEVMEFESVWLARRGTLS